MPPQSSHMVKIAYRAVAQVSNASAFMAETLEAGETPSEKDWLRFFEMQTQALHRILAYVEHEYDENAQ